MVLSAHTPDSTWSIPASGGLLISIVCMAIMLGPVKHSTYFRIWEKCLFERGNHIEARVCGFEVGSRRLSPVVKCSNGTVQGPPGSPGFWTRLSHLQQTPTSRSPHLSSAPDLESSPPVDTVAQTLSWRKQRRRTKQATKLRLSRSLARQRMKSDVNIWRLRP